MLANIINQILIYNDAVPTDNPSLKVADWSRRMMQVLLKSATSMSIQLAPGESRAIHDGVRVNPLDNTSELELGLISGSPSTYRMAVTAGTSGFRTPRAVSGIVGCVVAINNGVLAEFDFAGATLAGVVAGDTMRIKGQTTNDAGPYAFNPLNAGLWKVIGVSGTKVSVVRPTGMCFQAAPETVAAATADVQFYSADGIQKGDKFSIEGTFSTISHRIYEVLDVTPTHIDFMSAIALPTEEATFVPGSIVFYVTSKKLVYVEVDQEAVVRVNSDTSDQCRVIPFAPGSGSLIGFYYKTGETYKVVVVNKSLNTMTVQYILGE